jgi:hypothetical protein
MAPQCWGNGDRRPKTERHLHANRSQRTAWGSSGNATRCVQTHAIQTIREGRRLRQARVGAFCRGEGMIHLEISIELGIEKLFDCRTQCVQSRRRSACAWNI